MTAWDSTPAAIMERLRYQFPKLKGEGRGGNLANRSGVLYFFHGEDCLGWHQLKGQTNCIRRTKTARQLLGACTWLMPAPHASFTVHHIERKPLARRQNSLEAHADAGPPAQ